MERLGRLGGLSGLLEPLIGDGRVGTVHLCVFVALLLLSSGELGPDGLFVVRRTEVMRMAKIQGRTTYFRVMRDLERWGYITYEPSRDKGGRSKVGV